MSADRVSPDVRSRMMSGIKGKNTRPELLLRSALHFRGLRFRLHQKHLPGKPDLVFPRFKAVIFVNGCFWHGHECSLFRWPGTRQEFWRDKIGKTAERDAKSRATLLEAGWRVATVWECAMKGPLRLPVGDVADRCAAWLACSESELEIVGDAERSVG